MNYFKVVGPGLGKALHCYPFDGGTQEVAALAEAAMFAARFTHTKVVAWRRCMMHPAIPVVGEGPKKAIGDVEDD